MSQEGSKSKGDDRAREGFDIVYYGNSLLWKCNPNKVSVTQDSANITPLCYNNNDMCINTNETIYGYMFQ